MFSRGKKDKDEKKTGPGVPTVKLQNGVDMPTVSMGCSFGDFSGNGPPEAFKGLLPEKAWAALTHAEKCGFRSFNCANAYATGRHLGDVLGKRFAKDKLARDDCFLTMKLGHPQLPPPHARLAHNRTWNPRDVKSIGDTLNEEMDHALSEVGVGYFDLVLLSWPGPLDETDAEFARNARKEMWTQLVDFLKRGTARAIGVSNFSAKHLTELLEDSPVKPMVNQLELHPYCQEPALVDFCHENGIVVSCTSPFAAGRFGIFEDPVLQRIAKKANKHVAQVILRWHIQQGRVVAPKSSREKHLHSNLDVFNFKLSEEELESIATLQPEGKDPQRLTPDPLRIA